MKILVTGGAGFIGSHLSEALVRRGHTVRVLDNMYSGRPRNLHAVRGDVEIVKGDCSDKATVRRVMKGIEVVYHEAAVPSVARSVAQPLVSHRMNATGTITVLEGARNAGVRRVIYAGSSSVYGETPELPKREDMAPAPKSPYAVAKLVGEQYLRVFSELYGLEALTLRYFNVFGPRQDAGSPYSGVISLFITRLLAGQTPVIYGDGKQSRDFTFVENVVDGNLRALETKAARGQAVNVATGRRVTLNKVLSTVVRELKVKVEPRFEEARMGDIRHSVADIALARKLLGYEPVVDFETGLRRTLDWYRSGAKPAR